MAISVLENPQDSGIARDCDYHDDEIIADNNNANTNNNAAPLADCDAAGGETSNNNNSLLHYRPPDHIHVHETTTDTLLYSKYDKPPLLKQRTVLPQQQLWFRLTWLLRRVRQLLLPGCCCRAAAQYADFRTVSFVGITLVLGTLTTHRLLSVYMTHRKWINAPITYMERTCPVPDYPTLLSTMEQQNDFVGRGLLSEKDIAVSPNGGGAAAAAAAIISSPQQQTPKRPNICLTTLTDSKSPSRFQRFLRWRNFDGILELTWKNKLAYANKHGYRIFDGSHLLDTSRPPAWTKIRAVQYLLQLQQTVGGDDDKSSQKQEPACDWVVWTDADTIIMNSSIRIESFLPASDNNADSSVDLLVGSDNGGGYNSGVFLFRNTDWSRQFLESWWNCQDFVRPPGFSLSGDNHALKALLKKMPEAEMATHVRSPARCTFNSFAKFLTLADARATMDHLEEQDWYLSENYYHQGDFIAHTPGYDNKAETLHLLLQEAK